MPLATRLAVIVLLFLMSMLPGTVDSPVNALLSQIRRYHDHIARPEPDQQHGDGPRSNSVEGAYAAPLTNTHTLPGFTETLRGALGAVNRSQQNADALADAFERGEPHAGLAQVMVAAQQSQLAFRATVETRNRLVQAYQDVMNMPL